MLWPFATVQKSLEISIFSILARRPCSPLFVWVRVLIGVFRVPERPPPCEGSLKVSWMFIQQFALLLTHIALSVLKVLFGELSSQGLPHQRGRWPNFSLQADVCSPPRSLFTEAAHLQRSSYIELVRDTRNARRNCWQPDQYRLRVNVFDRRCSTVSMLLVPSGISFPNAE